MLRNTGRLTWIESSGGPLLLLGEQYLRLWRGITAPASSGAARSTFRIGPFDVPATDYDRARTVTEYLGLLDVGEGQALVLDAAPLITTWWSRPGDRSGGMLARYIYADDEAAVLRHLTAVPVALWQPTSIVLSVRRSPLYLFDCTYSGDDLSTYLIVELRPGAYQIDSAFYEPDDTAALLLHRFRRV